MRPIPGRSRGPFVAPLAIFSGTLLLRMLLIGGPPFTDEGIYAFNAQMVWMGERSFPVAPINVYPALVRWAGMTPSAPFLGYRIVDGLIAAGAAVTLFLFLSQWTESTIALVMASAWSLASNLPLFVEAGFKNSIMAATLVYLAALRSLCCRSHWSPFLAGLLIPIAVLLREPFLPIAIVSLFLSTMIHGRRGLAVHIAGLSIAGCLLLLWLHIFRGPPDEILGYFLKDLPMVYAHVSSAASDEITRRSSMALALRATRWMFPTAALGVCWLSAPGRDQRVAKGLAILLLAAPIAEIFAKLCFPYHWAQLLLGLTFLGAMGLNWLVSFGHSPNRRWPAIAGLIAVAWVAGELDGRGLFHAYRKGYHLSREFAPVMVWGRWDDPSVRRSAYLEVASYIRDVTTPDDRVIVSGGCEGLYALSGRRPPSASSADLTWMSAMRYPVRRPEVIESLRRSPPRLVIIRSNAPVALDEFWPDFEARYKLVKSFSEDHRKHYGAHATRIWRLKD